MAANEFELHPDRLGTSDEQGRRLFLFPADVKGVFRTARTRVQAALIVFFLALPWVKIQGRQALLLNIAERKFEIFGLSLRAHNAPLLILVAAAAAFALFFATAVFGRIWCGWACPQTVFIDGVFRRIERWIEGPAHERRKLARSPLTFRGLLKRTLKWTLYLAATLVITHSFIAYFVGVDRLAIMIRSDPSQNWGVFLFMLVSSAVILFDFAWFREQFCTLVCPYGRFQSVLMDKSSTVVAYDVARGEPRATPQTKVIAKAHGTPLGDCVNCYRCVQVCPTGIDIRRGLQMECIACTSCIDACDDVMTKLKKPTGLIRYDSLLPNAAKKSIFTLRSSVYLGLCVASIATLTVLLACMKPLEVQLLRAHDAPYSTTQLENGEVSVINHFRLELSNQGDSKRNVVFEVADAESKSVVQIVSARPVLTLDAGQVTHSDLFFRFPKTALQNGDRKIRLRVRDERMDVDDSIQIEKEVTLVGPFS